MDEAEEKKDVAGLRPSDHYQRHMPKWRYTLRMLLLPIIRKETPYLHWIQKHFRTPFGDTYFAATANLGTHTFFMIMLPMTFWFGYMRLGRAMVHVLASGVFFSGFLKDLLCLPRPLSPPLHRLTMSGGAALEYGFPSTHTTNAASVAFYIMVMLHECNSGHGVWMALTMVYLVSIAVGRIYCGMHGFIDVFAGMALGGSIALLRWTFRDAIDSFVFYGDWFAPFSIVLGIMILVRVHPEPVDDCPCFDDGVAFAGVVMGIETGTWAYAGDPLAWSFPSPATIPFDYAQMGPSVAFARVAVGVLVIFSWRALMKPFLHRILPPIYRAIEGIGLLMPRRYFMGVSQYKSVPEALPDATLGGFQEIPGLIHRMRRARRDSVGPQSAADMYETLDYREKQNRSTVVDSSAKDDQEAQEAMMAGIEHPRVRYDVEVVAKLVVYTGIGFLVVRVNPMVFHILGLSIGPTY